MINFAENLTKMITAGLGGETEAPRTEVAVGHRIQNIDASGPVASFDTNIVAPLKKLIVSMLPVQAGSGDPSPENVRPISGRSAVTVLRTGKNLLDSSAATIGVNWNGNALAYSIASDYIPVEANASYVFSVSDMPKFSSVVVACLDAGKTYLTSKLSQVFTTPSDCAYVRISIRCASNQSWTDEDLSAAKIQLERGSAASGYAAYDGQSVTIAFGQTVYGGTLDVVSGKLTVTDVSVTHTGSSIIGMPVESKFYIRNGCDGAKTENTNIGYLSNMYAFGGANNGGSNSVTEDLHFYAQPQANPTRLWVYDSGYTSIENFKTFLAEHPLTVVYPLAEPVEIDLTPHQITSLIGDNNVWSDAGDVDVTYTYYEETEGY